MKLIFRIISVMLLAVLMISCTKETSIEETTASPETAPLVTEIKEATQIPETAVTPDTTVLPETTAIPETTILPETTLPSKTTIPEETHSNLYDPELSVEDAIRFFSEVCLDAEYVNSGDPSVLQKWTVPIYYSIAGTPTEKDKTVIEETAHVLNSIEGFPGMYPSSESNPANMNIYFCPESDFAPLTGYPSNGNDGFVSFWYNGFNEIYSSVICIRNDIDQELRNSVIMEEIYNGLGPIQDTKLREDSIIFTGFSAPQAMTNTDLLILRLLYHPTLFCGMNADECARIISQLYY